MPTYAYEYETALREGYLADYHCIAKTFSIPTNGVTYAELSAEERARYEDAFEEGEEPPEMIAPSEIDRIYFNADTTRQVIADLMGKGLKIEGGDKLGKTIIFARSHAHAEHIAWEFDRLYPAYHGEFARVIDHAVKNHESLLNKFRDPAKLPQIAISVDMLDTGIDIHEILNLVFYKRVFSKAKFWQMFGRGTRLCKNIFGADKDKTVFYIFDYMGNFVFFAQNPKTIDALAQKSLAERAFGLKVRIIEELQKPAYQTEELQSFRTALAGEISAAIGALNPDLFAVRQQLAAVQKYGAPAALNALDITAAEEIIARLAPLIPPTEGDEGARRLDVILYRMMLARAAHETASYDGAAKTVMKIAARLMEKSGIPAVHAAADMLKEIRTAAFWTHADLPAIERIRAELRALMQYLRTEIHTKVINITDEVLSTEVGMRLTKSTALDGYYERANRYVRENENVPALQKLRNNIPLAAEDWAELQRIFWEEVGSAAEFRVFVPGGVQEEDHLGTFVRSLTGLSEDAARAAFSDFLDTALYTEEQIAFVRQIMEWVMKNGTMNEKELGNDQNFGGVSIFKVFHDNKTLAAIAHVLKRINANAKQAAA